MKVSGIAIACNGLLLIGEALLFATVMLMGTALSGFGGGQRATSTSGVNGYLVAGGFFLVGVAAVSWGLLSLPTRRTSWFRVGIGTAFVTVFVLFAMFTSRLWLVPWALVALAAVVHAVWVIQWIQERVPGSPWRNRPGA